MKTPLRDDRCGSCFDAIANSLRLMAGVPALQIGNLFQDDAKVHSGARKGISTLKLCGAEFSVRRDFQAAFASD